MIDQHTNAVRKEQTDAGLFVASEPTSRAIDATRPVHQTENGLTDFILFRPARAVRLRISQSDCRRLKTTKRITEQFDHDLDLFRTVIEAGCHALLQ